MNTFEHKGDTFAIIDGHLWLKLHSGATPPISDIPTRAKKQRVPHGMSKGKLIEQDDLKRIKEMINAGYKAQEIAIKFDVGAQYVYIIKSKMKRDGELTLTNEPE